MIRPVLYVDLPGIIYAIDRRARAHNSEFAHFICTPDAEESRASLTSLFTSLFPINPSARTWLCEDHWRILGVAQARRRAGGGAWDLTYLASLPNRSAEGASDDDVLLELLEYAVNAAIMHGVQRIFAKVDEETAGLELFLRCGFQRYARELTFWLPAGAANTPPPALELRRWHRHDQWGLLRLYSACAPRVVQIAENVDSSEYTGLRVGQARRWQLPLLPAREEGFVYDLGVRLGGWVQVRYGRGPHPHQIALMVHPDNTDLATPLLHFGLSLLGEGGDARPVYCQVREYEGAVVSALRDGGFEHAATRALLVRHLTLRAMRRRLVPALEQRVAYGVKGLGTAHTRYQELSAQESLPETAAT
jgi:hypothetical protein